MALLRRRSRDGRASEVMPQAIGPESCTTWRSRKVHSIVVIAVSLFSLTAIVLLARSRWHSSIPLGHLETGKENKSFSLINGSGGICELRPQDHIFREATTIWQKWRVSSGWRRPDGVSKRVYLVNGAFPGPTLEARSGDRLVIEVENALEEAGLSLHWHGLSMRGANGMDGAAGITNPPIAPGDAFVYNFTIEEGQYGTFWYHAHDGVQRADGLYGGLVVHQPRPGMNEKDIDAEHLLMLGDWYHRTAEKALDFYMHPGSFGNEPVPDSILLNGAGAYNCVHAVPARPVDCEQRALHDLPALTLGGKRRNLFRIINVGAYAGISISIPGTHLTPMAVDGGNRISAQRAKSVSYLHPGERVDAVIEPIGGKGTMKTTIDVSLDTGTFKYDNPALTSTHSFPLVWEITPARPGKSLKQSIDQFDLNTARSSDSQAQKLPKTANHTIVLYAITQKLSHLRNVPRGFINNTSWQPQATPPLPLAKLSRDLWDTNQLVPHFGFDPNEPLWIDIVLNNLDEEAHPFHLHGYDFWVLSTYSSTFNWGSYNPFEENKRPGGAYDFEGAVKKDTVAVPRRGYAVLRFWANNPGIWMFHCHVLWHQAAGMAMAFEVSG